MPEAPGPSLLVPEKTPIDSDLWQAFEEIESKTAASFDQLQPNDEHLEVAKENFFSSGQQAIPNLRATPSRKELKALQTKESRLVEFKRQLLQSDLSPIAKQAYRWRINEEIASARMVEASVRGDMGRFRAYNYFIYGKPDPEIFAATVDFYRKDAGSSLNHESEPVRRAAQEVLELLKDEGGNADILKPSDDVFRAVKESQFREDGYFTLVLAGVELPDINKFTAEEGNPIVQQALKNMGSNYGMAPAKGVTWSADHQKKVMKYPIKYNLELRRFLGLPIGHEARHILERLNGLRQEMRLFGGGLDHYEPGNEGRAIIGEQIPYDTFDEFAQTERWQMILRRHLATSLAEGLATDNKTMDFPQTFKVVNAIDRLVERRKKPDEPEKADARAARRSWLLTESVMKGTDGHSGAYGRYKLYLEGNISAWRAAEDNPELIRYGDYGKFDISNPRHIALAQATGVIPITE